MMPLPRARRATILGVVGIAGATVLAAQVLLRGLFLDLEVIDGRLVSAVFHIIVVVTPVVFFLAWRTTVERKIRVEEMLASSEALREELTSMLVHDLKNPVISAGLALGALRGSTSGESRKGDDESEMLAIARESLIRLEKMIDDVLDISRAEGGSMLLERSVVDIGEVVRAAVRQSGPQLSDARIELSLDVSGGALCALADAGKIRRVVDNLLANAIKFTPAKGRISVSASNEGQEAVVRVRDTGPGVPESARSRIFDKFGQADRHDHGRGRSVGLGLYFSKLVVDAHAGRIWVESSEGEGSEFCFALPLAEDEE